MIGHIEERFTMRLLGAASRNKHVSERKRVVLIDNTDADTKFSPQAVNKGCFQ